MPIKKSIDREEIEQYFHKDYWGYGNKVLYDMCRTNPGHMNADIAVGKIWLIGRSYAAAIERRKDNSDGLSADDFYIHKVAPGILKIGKELDERLDELNQYKAIKSTNLNFIIETHNILTSTFSNITELNKRSLASKYLHFHAPNISIFTIPERIRRQEHMHLLINH